MKADQTQYSVWLKVMHWGMALGFLFMWGTGFYMSEVVTEDSPLEELLFDLHISSGVTLLFLLALRIIVRIVTVLPAPIRGLSRLEKAGAHLGHVGLYLLPALGMFIGWAEVDFGGHGVKWFGNAMPKLFPTMETWLGIDLGESTEAMHRWLAYSMLALTVVHIAAVIKHRWFDGHDVLYRMTFSRRK